MAISHIGSAAAATTSLTLPAARLPGDLELMYVFRSGSTTAPTVPAGWRLVKSTTTTSTFGGLYYRWCVSGDTSGTWTNATDLICEVYRGAYGLGGSAVTGAVGTSISYTTFTMVQSAGNSWVAGFGGHRTATNVNTAPTGMVNNTSVGAGPMVASFDTNGGVASWSTKTVTVNASSGNVGITVEILADNSTLDPYFKSSLIALSSGNKTATGPASGTNTVANSYGSLPRTGERRLFKFSFTTVTVDDPTFGIANLNSITNASIGDSGDANNSLGLTFTGGVFLNAVQIATVSGFGNGDTVWVAVDDLNKKIYFATNSGTWNNASASPDGNSGGISYSGMNPGVIVPAQSFFDGGEVDAYDGNPPNPPAGAATFANWDTKLIPNKIANFNQAMNRAANW